MPLAVVPLSLSPSSREPIPMVRFSPRGKGTPARLARPSCMEVTKLFVLHDSTRGAVLAEPSAYGKPNYAADIECLSRRCFARTT